MGTSFVREWCAAAAGLLRNWGICCFHAGVRDVMLPMKCFAVDASRNSTIAYRSDCIPVRCIWDLPVHSTVAWHARRFSIGRMRR